MQLCIAGGYGAEPCSEECQVSTVEMGQCVLPRAPSGMRLPAIFTCTAGGATVNATYFNSVEGKCDAKAGEFGGVGPQRVCSNRPTLSYAIDCIQNLSAIAV